MSEYARCLVNGLGKKRYQPKVGKRLLWGYGDLGNSTWSSQKREGDWYFPLTYKYRWMAIYVAKRAERRWAKKTFTPCQGDNNENS